MRGLGIDPGTSKNNIGWAIVNNNKYVESGILLIPQKSTGFPYKLIHIYEYLVDVIKTYNIQLLAVESFFFSKKRTGSTRIHELRGVIQLISAQQNIKFVDTAPTTVKLFVAGSGKASKECVAKSIATKLKVDTTNKNSHETDAIAIAMTGYHVYTKNGK